MLVTFKNFVTNKMCVFKVKTQKRYYSAQGFYGGGGGRGWSPPLPLPFHESVWFPAFNFAVWVTNFHVLKKHKSLDWSEVFPL